MGSSRCNTVLAGSCAALVWAVVGCGPASVERPSAAKMAGYESEIDQIKADPLAFLRQSFAKTCKLKRFSTEFHRQERLGLLGGQLKPLERMQADYRTDPLSIRFTWMDADYEYQQAVYVEGKHDNQVVLLPKLGLFGLPPQPAKYPPNWAVVFSKSKFPITDFGPKRLMEKTIARIDKAMTVGEVRIAVRGTTEVGPLKELCYHFEIRYPAKDEFPTKLHDLYIHARTHLPVATFLWLPGKDERSSETLDAMYEYIGLNADAPIDDSTFRIDLDTIKQVRRAATKQKADTAEPSPPTSAPQESSE